MREASDQTRSTKANRQPSIIKSVMAFSSNTPRLLSRGAARGGIVSEVGDDKVAVGLHQLTDNSIDVYSD